MGLRHRINKQHRSPGSEPARRAGVIGAAAAVGALLVVGVTPPAAHADLDDLLMLPVVDTLGTVDPGVDAGDLLAPALAAAADVTSIPDLGGSLTSLDGLLSGWFQTFVYDPIQQLGQLWITSPLGQTLDQLISHPFAALTGTTLTDGGTGGGLGWLFGEHAVPGAAAAPTDPAGALTNASVPLDVRGTTEPVVNISVGGGRETPVLIDTGSSGLVIPIWDVGWQNIGLPTGLGIGAYSGGMQYVYLTLPSTVDFGKDIDTGLPLVTDQTLINAVLFAYPTVPFGPWTINDFLAGHADGILGVAPDAVGPTPGHIVVTDLPGDLGKGLLIDQPNHTLTFGPNPLVGGVQVNGVASSTVYVSIDGGAPHATRAIIDSGGVWGTMPSSLLGTGQTSGPVPPGTVISVTNGSGQQLYSYTVGPNNAPTVIASGSMNTGNVPFAQQPVYHSTVGNGYTVFGGTRPDTIEP